MAEHDLPGVVDCVAGRDPEVDELGLPRATGKMPKAANAAMARHFTYRDFMIRPL
jgi:hypothetical protein